MNSNVCKANSDSLTRLGSKIRPPDRNWKKTNASYSPRNWQTISSTTQDGWCITFFFFGSPEKISDLTDGAIRCFTNDAAISSPCCETNIYIRERGTMGARGRVGRYTLMAYLPDDPWVLWHGELQIEIHYTWNEVRVLASSVVKDLSVYPLVSLKQITCSARKCLRQWDSSLTNKQINVHDYDPDLRKQIWLLKEFSVASLQKLHNIQLYKKK